jgi:hypothetical protein
MNQGSHLKGKKESWWNSKTTREYNIEELMKCCNKLDDFLNLELKQSGKDDADKKKFFDEILISEIID